MSNSQSLKRINLQNLRVCPSTLRQLLLYTVETTVESTIRLSRRWQCRSGHQQRFLGQTQERMPRLQELVQRQVLCFSHVFLWALLAMPKTEKNGNTKMRCHHETRVIHGKKYVFDMGLIRLINRNNIEKTLQPTFQWRWFSMGWWLSCPEK